jgi:Mrp family chromosome partitioning ATPase
MRAHVAKANQVLRVPAKPTIRSRLGRLLRPRSADSPALLSYRFLARQIEMDLPLEDGSGRTILMSSSVPPASSNEAMLLFSYALAEELGSRILLVDSTFGDAGVGAILGHVGAPGVIDLLYGTEHALTDLVLPTKRHNISVLPAGRPRIGRLLPIEADRVVSLYEPLCNRFDYILVQQGPISEDTRYLAFATKADLVVLMVEEGVTQVDELDRSLDVFRNHQITNIRLVLCAPR